MPLAAALAAGRAEADSSTAARGVAAVCVSAHLCAGHVDARRPRTASLSRATIWSGRCNERSSVGLPAPRDAIERARLAPYADGLVVSQHEAISVDGERIPYVQTGPARETGDAPVYMTGYGGFGMAVKPYYVASLGKLWLERGGTTVQANLRGGGEFGTRWHDAGRGAGKRLSHDDFAAVAADLVRRGVTRPGRIAARADRTAASSSATC